MIGTYYRLSLADENVGADKAESNSIQGQRGLVEGYIMARPELAAEPRQEYVDDGYSGTSTSRPAFQRLIQDAQDGKVKTIIVKDFSRFARDYIEAGDYMERIFPLLGVRFISVNDGYDLSLIHISEPTRRTPISYAVFCLKKKNEKNTKTKKKKKREIKGTCKDRKKHERCRRIKDNK